MTHFMLICCLIILSSMALTCRGDEVDQMITAGMSCRNIPGLSVAIVQGDQVLRSQGYGVKDEDLQDSVDADTLFSVASTTKAFTAALLSHVVHELPSSQSVSISTNVRKVLPTALGFKFNNSQRTIYTSMEDLLGHRVGIPKNNYIRLSTDNTPEPMVSKLRYLRSAGGFRDSFFYSNIMYGLATVVTEQLGSQPWKQQIDDSIFTPLGMSRSTFVDDVDFTTENVATPYVRESGTNYEASIDFIKHWGKTLGSGNIMSSSNDMAKWMMMLLNDGKTNSGGSQVLDPEVVEEVFKPINVIPEPDYMTKYRIPVTPVSFTSGTYSLGWRHGVYKGHKMIYHTGSTFGYRAQVTLLPDQKVGVVTLMTGSDYQYKFRHALHMYLLDHTLGDTPWLNSSTICSFPDPWRAAASSSRKKRSVGESRKELKTELEGGGDEDSEEEEEEGLTRERRDTRANRVAREAGLPLSSYEGTYRQEAYGNLIVTLNTSTNALNAEYGVGLWRLDPSGGHEFDGVWLKARPKINKAFLFNVNGNDEVESVEGTGFEPYRPPVFMKIA